VVGHSLCGNFALEMAALGTFSGPVVLLSPAFSREDEVKELAVLNSLGRVPGVAQLAWATVLKTIGRAMKGSFPAARHDALVAEMKTSDPRVCRRQVRVYFEYLDRHGSLVSRLCDSGVKAWVVRGDRDEVGLTDEERRGLEACPNVTLVTVPDAAHFVMTDQPARTAELILEVASVE
jgi:pimeloyl-ACP methyl ester carboxylesterase